MLRVRNLHVSYGVIKAVKGISIEVAEADVRTIIGANGAGKSTILKAVIGLLKPKEGAIGFAGREIQGMHPHKIARLGIAYVPEDRSIFTRMTALENLYMGAFILGDQDRIGKNIKKVCETFPILFARRNQLAGTLSGGEQQMLAIGRALMSDPRLLLLDEPSLGLAPMLITQIFAVIKNITAAYGTSILIVEQNVGKVLAVSKHGYLVENGYLVLEDGADALSRNQKIKDTYLGG
jgi:branched-chain amino acid transport system ATP-binding protein